MNFINTVLITLYAIFLVSSCNSEKKSLSNEISLDKSKLHFNQGLELYTNGEEFCDDAVREFNLAMKYAPKDGSSEIHVELCQSYLKRAKLCTKNRVIVSRNFKAILESGNEEEFTKNITKFENSCKAIENNDFLCYGLASKEQLKGYLKGSKDMAYRIKSLETLSPMFTLFKEGKYMAANNVIEKAMVIYPRSHTAKAYLAIVRESYQNSKNNKNWHTDYKE